MTTMAITSSSAARLPPMLPTYNSSISHKLRPSSLSLLSNASSSSLKTLKPSLSSSRVFAASELLSSQETPDGLEDSATIEVCFFFLRFFFRLFGSRETPGKEAEFLMLVEAFLGTKMGNLCVSTFVFLKIFK